MHLPGKTANKAVQYKWIGEEWVTLEREVVLRLTQNNYPHSYYFWKDVRQWRKKSQVQELEKIL